MVFAEEKWPQGSLIALSVKVSEQVNNTGQTLSFLAVFPIQITSRGGSVCPIFTLKNIYLEQLI